MKPTIWTAAATSVPVLEQLDMTKILPVTDETRAAARRSAELVRQRIKVGLQPFRNVRRRR
jgi:hypothetical protein